MQSNAVLLRRAAELAGTVEYNTEYPDCISVEV